MRENKLFVKTMIITAMLALVVIPVSMFIGIKSFVQVKEPAQVFSDIGSSSSAAKDTSPTSKMTGVVEDINGRTVKVLDIGKNEYVYRTIEEITQVQDAYQKPIPLDKIKKGDVVEIICDIDTSKVLSMAKVKGSWLKTNIKNIDIDISNQKMYIGENVYSFTDYTLVLGKRQDKISIHQIGKYDTLELTGVGDKVYSIKVLKEQGTIEIGTLPLYEGIIEIDRNRQINLQNLNAPIPVEAGKHKVVIKMNGYETVVQEVEVKEGENSFVLVDNPKEAYTEIMIELMNSVTAYTVEVDGTVYAQDASIKVKRGRHHIKVNAEGFKSWAGDIAPQEPTVRLQVTLEPLVAEQPKEDKVPEVPATPEVPVTPEVPTTPEVPIETTNKANAPEYNLNISTDPDGAKVYVDGEYKGTTPYSAILPLGEHKVLLQKEGYEEYTTSLTIEDSNNQNSHLYILTPSN